MKRMLYYLIGFAMIGLSSGAQEEATPVLSSAVTQTVQVVEKNPAEMLYMQAVAEREAGQAKQAIQTVAQVITLHTGESAWLAKSEILAAELYLELGMLDAADVTARQVQALHEGSPSAEKADALRSTIEKLRMTTNGETKK